MLVNMGVTCVNNTGATDELVLSTLQQHTRTNFKHRSVNITRSVVAVHILCTLCA